MKKILAILCDKLISYTKQALIGFVETKIKKAVKANKITEEHGGILKEKANDEIEKIFKRIAALQSKIQKETGNEV